MNNYLCGSSCVKYILNNLNKSDKTLNKKMQWILELAVCLKKNGISNIKVLCFNSNLFFDFANSKDLDLNFDGFRFIQECLNINIPIQEKKLNKKELIKEVKESSYIILCVESSLFNHESSMDGGHFIILNGLVNNKIKVINPIKDKYEFRIEDINNIIKYCKNYGSWRILIKEDNE